jgi:hypothetical protein
MKSFACCQVQGQRRRCSEEISDIRKEISSLGAMQDDLLHALTDLRLGIESAVTVAAGSLPEDCSVAKKRGAWGPFQMVTLYREFIQLCIVVYCTLYECANLLSD